jgi:DNA-binding GntR family transcriptional regulator
MKEAQRIAPHSLDRLIDVAYRRVRHGIISCEFEPGCKVTEAQLALRLGLGRAATRAALMRLAQDKLVTALPRRGYKVTPVRLRDVHEIFHLRALLEPEAVRLCVDRIDTGKLEALDKVCAKAYTPGDRRSEEAFLRANQEFHTTIIRACGNERLADLLENIIDQMERLFHVGLTLSNRRTELRQQHAELVRLLLKRDGEKAASIARGHIETMRKMVMDGVMVSEQMLDFQLATPDGLFQMPK